MTQLFENETAPQKAILVAVDTGAYDADVSIDELSELAITAGAETIASVIQKRSALDRATAVGSGRLEEIKEFAEAQEANLLIFDCELTASQMGRISDAVGIAVIDRTMLILDIFAQRAHTSEGRLQVELAQLRYRLPRLTGQGKALSRLGGGIGTRGPGETKLESDRRHIRRRIQMLEEKLEKTEKRRKELRQRRKRDGVTTAAIVGYTNVGKSTLLNALTDAGILAEDKLFATLDPTSRALALPDGRNILLIDTVGFVRRLPHQLVRAFHATLEEAASADLLICLCDASSAEAAEQVEVTRELMRELGVTDTPMLVVFNKCDLPEDTAAAEGLIADVRISAKNGSGFPQLLNAIERALPPAQTRVETLIPFDKGGLLAEIRKDGRILEERYEEDGIHITALIDTKILHKIP